MASSYYRRTSGHGHDGMLRQETADLTSASRAQARRRRRRRLLGSACETESTEPPTDDKRGSMCDVRENE